MSYKGQVYREWKTIFGSFSQTIFFLNFTEILVLKNLDTNVRFLRYGTYTAYYKTLRASVLFVSCKGKLLHK
jgi:hypothetical protein